jgi:glycosyltransferase involved in cell wall biosynthesis
VILPRISVITPSLNQGEYIEDAILSVAHQKYPDVEHIIVDGGSIDDTLAVLKRYSHLRWISEPDNGQSDAINKGFRMATGDLVVWLNADDYYLPGALQAIGQFGAEHPKVDIVYGDSIHVDGDGKLLRLVGQHAFDGSVLLYSGCHIDSNTTFFRRNITDDGFLLDVGYRVVMDFEYFVRLAMAGKTFHYVPALVGAFRWTGANYSLQGSKRRRERLQVQRRWSPRKLPDFGYDALATLFRLKRILLKAMNGNYRRELEIRKYSGRPTDWFRSEEGRATCASLLENAHSGLRRAEAHCRV